MGPNFNTLEELLASSEVSDNDKQRAYKCWKRRQMVAFRVISGNGEQPEPLSSGDEVVLVGLGHNKSLNGEAGVLGAYDPESERWEIPAHSARVKEQNLVKKQWMKAARYNCSIFYHGSIFLMHIGDDRMVRCLSANGGEPPNTCSICIQMSNHWLHGYNFDAPERSDFDA